MFSKSVFLKNCYLGYNFTKNQDPDFFFQGFDHKFTKSFFNRTTSVAASVRDIQIQKPLLIGDLQNIFSKKLLQYIIYF